MAKKPCVALINYDTKTHLSGDCRKLLKCKLTGKRCIARVIKDSDNESNMFFSRAKAKFDRDKAQKCPIFNRQNVILDLMSNKI